MDHHDHMHHMGHSSHSGMDHGSPDSAGPMCNMNMLFTWSTDNLCIVFRQWRITSTPSLLVSLALIVTICAGYEALREGIRRYDAVVARRLDTAPRQNRDAVTRRAHYIKAILYGIQNFYAFMIMLIFMTYNGWVMLAVSFGAGLGYLLFGGKTPVAKETACH
ncbi:putative copper transport protein [Thermochaetoides thermophila DSM 1495]|uniref:Copper transport protein n=1 Tax=Chaetomium thermophilum (strain DSM 1495 / CBS 144.50 / IMI 039719) TaxID=759272 RepID=G0SCC2_CHATD|nr:putative copper transport protein [Thermochaetoides thermophila DSM 1495]EGS19048.1 putative copper transport protein [Thermochaetoides thermophila DSM 1495]